MFMRCCQALLRFVGEGVDTRSVMLDGYQCCLDSILAEQKLGQKRENR